MNRGTLPLAMSGMQCTFVPCSKSPGKLISWGHNRIQLSRMARSLRRLHVPIFPNRPVAPCSSGKSAIAGARTKLQSVGPGHLPSH